MLIGREETKKQYYKKPLVSPQIRIDSGLWEKKSRKDLFDKRSVGKNTWDF